MVLDRSNIVLKWCLECICHDVTVFINCVISHMVLLSIISASSVGNYIRSSLPCFDDEQILMELFILDNFEEKASSLELG